MTDKIRKIEEKIEETANELQTAIREFAIKAHTTPLIELLKEKNIIIKQGACSIVYVHNFINDEFSKNEWTELQIRDKNWNTIQTIEVWDRYSDDNNINFKKEIENKLSETNQTHINNEYSLFLDS